MNIVPNKFHFSSYPTDHLLGILPDAESVQRLNAGSDTSGLAPEAVKVFFGEAGARQFGGEHQGMRGWLEQLSRSISGTSEGRVTYMSALYSGCYVVAVDLQGRLEEKQAVVEMFKAVGARDVNFLGSLMVEKLE